MRIGGVPYTGQVAREVAPTEREMELPPPGSVSRP